MPVAVLDVQIPTWNRVVIESVLHGIDMYPDTHRATGNTVVELTGTWEKLNQVINKVNKKSIDPPILLAVMESKQIS